MLLQFLLLSSAYDLQRDEFLHLDQANHPAWGYLSVPPFTSWTSFLIQQLGNSIFWIKFFPALYGALTILFVWKAIEELNGSLFALILGATCVLFSALLRLNTLYQPNSFDVLSWTAFYFFLIKYLKTADQERTKERPLFDTVYLATQRVNQFAREDTISIFLLRGARVDINKLLKDEAEEKLHSSIMRKRNI